jgi:hypothetical protein
VKNMIKLGRNMISRTHTILKTKQTKKKGKITSKNMNRRPKLKRSWKSKSRYPVKQHLI